MLGYNFIPGKSSKLKKLLRVLNGAKKIYILIYANPDPDALASAWALKEILQDRGISSEIGYTGKVGRPENEAMIQTLHMPVLPVNEENLKQAERVALVDCQPDFFKEFNLPRCDIVFDHHPKKGELGVPFSDIRTKCLATSSILTEYLIENKTPVHRRLATALYYGIQTDSRGILKNPSPVDSAALHFLETKANKTLLRRIEFSHYSLNDLDYFRVALGHRFYARNVLYAHVGNVPSSDVCVQVADFLIRVKEAHWALVTGIVNDLLVIVFRCDGHMKNAGNVANLAFGKLGSAGGHKTMGRAEVNILNLPEQCSSADFQSIAFFVVSELAQADPAFRPLFRLIQKK